MLVTRDNFQYIVDTLLGLPLLSCDTETTGLEWGDRLFSVIISDDSTDYYFDKRVLGKDFAGDAGFRMIFENPGRTISFKNAKFDMRMLAMEGIHVGSAVEDIGIGARILKNDYFHQRAYALEYLAAREGMEKLKIVEDHIKANKLYEVRKTRLGEEYKQPCFDQVPLDVIATYACKDARLTYDLRGIYCNRMDEDDRRVYDNESKLIKVCFGMEMRGIRTDQSYTRKGYEYEQTRLKGKKRHFLQATGKDYQDSKALLIPIFKQAGEAICFTEKGNESLTDDVLETYTSPVAKIVQDIRYSEKRIATYYENYINGADEHGIIRPTMWQEGTRTGRFSYSNPNLQNIPKEKGSSEPYVIRGCFVPRDGNVFVSFDYSQMEYRLMLAYAEETRLIQEVMNGKDVHQATADLLGIDRDPAKTLNFAILYGAGAEKLAGMLGISVAEAARLRTKYFLGLPQVERFIGAVIRTGERRGYVKNWLGRKLRADKKFCYALPNHLIQGGGADVVKVAMNEIAPLLEAEASPLTSMVLQVHDQLVFDMHPQDFKLIPKIQAIMEGVFPLMNGMRLLVDVQWSDKSFAERDMRKGAPGENAKAV